MSTKVHKNSQIKVPQNSVIDVNKALIYSDVSDENYNTQRILDLDIERENRLSEIISLYSKGFSQDEIAARLEINQSTVSRDLQLIKQQARSRIDKYLRKDILLEFTRYLSGSDEVIRELWSIIEDSYTEHKDKISTLKLLLQAYEKRHQRLVGAPESYLKIKRTKCDLEYQDFVESDPTRKAIAQMQKLDPSGSVYGTGNLPDRKIK